MRSPFFYCTSPPPLSTLEWGSLGRPCFCMNDNALVCKTRECAQSDRKTKTIGDVDWTTIVSSKSFEMIQ